MQFEHSEKTQELIQKVDQFMIDNLYPVEQELLDYIENAEDRWTIPPLLEELKAKAKSQGLWNFFLPDSDEYGYGLNNLEYAPLCELMGRSRFAGEIFNCSAPDTGNMEVFARYGTEEQKQQWLKPLLEGEIRSAFAMTEPAVASSDATNIQTSIVRDGNEYVVNGHKWYISGACDPRCKIMIVMGKNDPDNPDRHKQQSMILVPTDAEGVNIVRPMQVFGNDDAPEGHAEVVFDNVRVPPENMLLGEGRGFEIAQGRLGPGRIHHCMRLIGRAQRVLEMMCERAESRVAFGRKLSEQGKIREEIALSACEIEQARLLTFMAADQMDRLGNKAAKELIAMIKIVAPDMACKVTDRAIQMHGAAGVSQDTILADSYLYARICRIVDGPDQVHINQLGRNLIKRLAPA
jgi:acyl-CoA dehydrogenase